VATLPAADVPILELFRQHHYRVWLSGITGRVLRTSARQLAEFVRAESLTHGCAIMNIDSGINLSSCCIVSPHSLGILVPDRIVGVRENPRETAVRMTYNGTPKRQRLGRCGP
jgi:hypothetical protein